MKLRVRLDLFSAALLSALGASPLLACGGTVTTSAGAPGGGGGPGAVNHFPCENPTQLANGIEQCGGITHRASVQTCASKIPRPDIVRDPSGISGCQMDADCTDQPYGWC